MIKRDILFSSVITAGTNILQITLLTFHVRSVCSVFMVHIYHRDSRNNTNNEVSVIQFDPVEKDNAILVVRCS